MGIVVFCGKEFSTDVEGDTRVIQGDKWYHKILSGIIPEYTPTNLLVFKTLAHNNCLDNDTEEWVLEYYEKCKEVYQEVIKVVWQLWKLASNGTLKDEQSVEKLCCGIRGSEEMLQLVYDVFEDKKNLDRYITASVDSMKKLCTPKAENVAFVLNVLKKMCNS